MPADHRYAGRARLRLYALRNPLGPPAHRKGRTMAHSLGARLRGFEQRFWQRLPTLIHDLNSEAGERGLAPVAPVGRILKAALSVLRLELSDVMADCEDAGPESEALQFVHELRQEMDAALEMQSAGTPARRASSARPHPPCVDGEKV